MIKIEPDRLSKEELEYELNVRGITPQGTVKELVKILRECYSLENEGQTFNHELKLNINDELVICRDKLKDVETFLNNSFTDKLIRKIQSKLGHILYRIKRINPQEDDDIKSKSDLLSSALSCFQVFKKKQEIFKLKDREPLDMSFQQSLMNSPNYPPPQANLPNQTSSPVQQTNYSLQNLSNQMNNLNLDPKIKISNWGLTFNGESDSCLGLNAFLERVDELCEAKNVSKQYLFRSAVELFEGKALIYYRSLKHKINDWDTLCNVFKEEFLPRDYNEKLWEQIKSRTQGEKESIAIYVAYMTNIFNRLSIKVDESIKLKILRKNILPFYQNQLGLIDISSTDELISLCRKLEDNRNDVLNFKPPVYDKNQIESDLAYKLDKGIRKKVDSIEMDKQVSFSQNTNNDNSVNKNRENSKGRSYNRDRDHSLDRAGPSRYDVNDKGLGGDSGLNRENGGYRADSNYNMNRYEGNRNRYDRSSERDSRRANSYDKGKGRDRYTRSDYRRNRDSSYSKDRDNTYDTSRDRYHKDTDRYDRSTDRYDRSRDRHNREGMKRNAGGNVYNINRGMSGDRMRSDSMNSSPQNQYSRRSRYEHFHDNPSVSQGIRCFKCDGLNHLAKHCRSANIKCFKCGLNGYTKISCPRCHQGNDYRNRV